MRDGARGRELSHGRDRDRAGTALGEDQHGRPGQVPSLSCTALPTQSANPPAMSNRFDPYGAPPSRAPLPHPSLPSRPPKAADDQHGSPPPGPVPMAAGPMRTDRGHHKETNRPPPADNGWGTARRKSQGNEGAQGKLRTGSCFGNVWCWVLREGHGKEGGLVGGQWWDVNGSTSGPSTTFINTSDNVSTGLLRERA